MPWTPPSTPATGPSWWAGIAVPALRSAASGRVGVLYVFALLYAPPMTARGRIRRPEAGLAYVAPIDQSAAWIPPPGLTVVEGVMIGQTMARLGAPTPGTEYRFPGLQAQVVLLRPLAGLGINPAAGRGDATSPPPGSLLGANVPPARAAALTTIPDIGRVVSVPALIAAAFTLPPATALSSGASPGAAAGQSPAPTGMLVAPVPVLVAAAYTPTPGALSGVVAPPGSARASMSAPAAQLAYVIPGEGAAAASPSPLAALTELAAALAAQATIPAPTIVANQTVPVPNEIGIAAMPTPKVGLTEASPPLMVSAGSAAPAVAQSSGSTRAEAYATAAAPNVGAGQSAPAQRANSVGPAPVTALGAAVPPALAGAGFPAPTPVADTAPTMMPPGPNAARTSAPNVALLEVIPPPTAGAYIPTPQGTWTSTDVMYLGSSRAEDPATATPIAMPNQQSGDLMFMFVFRNGSTTAPTIPAGWTLEGTAQAVNGCWGALYYRWATANAEALGTWTGATGLIHAVYRNVYSFAMNINAVGYTTGSTGTITWPQLPATVMRNVDTAHPSWVAVFAAHRSVNGSMATPPAGTVNRGALEGATNDLANFDTNGGVTTLTPGTTNSGENGTGFVTAAVELFPNLVNVFENVDMTNAPLPIGVTGMDVLFSAIGPGGSGGGAGLRNGSTRPSGFGGAGGGGGAWVKHARISAAKLAVTGLFTTTRGAAGAAAAAGANGNDGGDTIFATNGQTLVTVGGGKKGLTPTASASTPGAGGTVTLASGIATDAGGGTETGAAGGAGSITQAAATNGNNSTNAGAGGGGGGSNISNGYNGGKGGNSSFSTGQAGGVASGGAGAAPNPSQTGDFQGGGGGSGGAGSSSVGGVGGAGGPGGGYGGGSGGGGGKEGSSGSASGSGVAGASFNRVQFVTAT